MSINSRYLSVFLQLQQKNEGKTGKKNKHRTYERHLSDNIKKSKIKTGNKGYIL